MKEGKMSSIHLTYLQKLSDKPVNTLDGLLKETRLLKSLWLELIFNPELVKECEKRIASPIIKNALIKALSWYLAFRWLFKKNPSIEKLAQKKIIKPFIIRDDDYKKDYRAFLKSILPLLN